MTRYVCYTRPTKLQDVSVILMDLAGRDLAKKPKNWMASNDKISFLQAILEHKIKVCLRPPRSLIQYCP